MLFLAFASFVLLQNLVFGKFIDTGDLTYSRSVRSAECPPNSIGLRLNASICYSFHPSHSQYVIAERECNSFGATLVSLNNKYTNVYVTQLANLFFKHLEVEQFWSNGHRLIDAETFRWINGDKIEYANFTNTKENEDCMAVNLEKGFWKHENCFTRLPFVCEFVRENGKEVPLTAINFETYANFEAAPSKLRQEITATTFQPLTMATDTATSTTPLTSTTMLAEDCPPSWTFNSATGFCYGVFHNMTWDDAEQKCIEEESHLTSIHSQEEAVFVGELTANSSIGSEIWYGQTLIGLVTEDEGETWKWTDGTPFDFHQWASDQPSTFPGEYENCGQIWSTRDYYTAFADFNNIHCDLVITNFVCKKSPN